MATDTFNSDAFIQFFRSTSPYLHAHRGRTLVLVVSGEAVEEPQFANLIHDVALLHGLGIRIVLVHGVRPQIEACVNQYNGESAYADELRVTDELAMSCAKRAIGEVRAAIEARLFMSNAKIRVSSGNLITAQPIGVHNGVDYLFTGQVRKIDQQAISQQLDAGDLVLVSPIGYSPSGEAFNLSSNDLGVCMAKAVGAEKLVYLHNMGDCHQHIQTDLRPREVAGLEKSFPHGFQQLLEDAAEACRNGVKRVHLLDQQIDGVLLQELFTRDGVGVMVSAEAYEETRTATIDDVAGILKLLAPLEEKGVLVRRSREKLETEIEHFTVMERDGMVVACAALYCFPDEKTAEIACVAVHDDYRNQGRGDALLYELQYKAESLGLNKLFVLTTQTAHWFHERGFSQADVNQLPAEKQRLYNYQRNSKIFTKSIG